MKHAFLSALAAVAVMFGLAPYLVSQAPYESTMGLVQKIFYYHAPVAMTMFVSAFVCGIASGVYLFKGREAADRLAVAAAELTVLLGAMVLVTGPLWARKAWGVWWQWDARLTSSLLLWMIFVAYLLVRKYGGPGSEKLSAAVALFGMANVPFVYISVNVWRTLHPKTSVVSTLSPGMRGPFWFCVVAFLLLYLVLLSVRYRIGQQEAEIETLYLELDDEAGRV